MLDPTFIDRCRLWAALVDLIPEHQRQAGERIAEELDSCYWDVANARTRLLNEADAKLAAANEQIGALESRITELAMVAAPTGLTTH